MKANCTFVVLLLFFYTTVYSQQKIPSFGKIDLADLEMKECPHDADADAYKLLDIGDVKYSQGKNLFRINTERRIRIKILKDKGIGHANIKIPFYSKLNTQRIIDLEAITYNLAPGGKITIAKLGKDAIYTQKVSNRYSTITFTMPEVKAGSVIEYKYVDVFESLARLEDWNFQDDIPTRYSKYTVEIPQYFNFTKMVMAYQHVEKTTAAGEDRINTPDGVLQYKTVIASYAMENIAALKTEPFTSSLKDYQQRIQFQLAQIDFGNGNTQEYRSTWPKLTKELLEDEDFGMQLKKNIPRTKDLDLLLAGVQDDYKKMYIIHNYVRANMTWNHGESIFANEGVKSAWDKKNGSNAEINMILINLLRDAGVRVQPMLVSTRDHGATNPVYPFLDQFNNVLAYVDFGDGKTFVLNAADKYNPVKLIPYDVLNTQAYLLSKDGGKWISLENKDHRWKNTVIISAEIDTDGIMKGEATVNSYDYSRNPRTKRYIEEHSRFAEYFSEGNVAMKLDSIIVANLEADSMPLEQKLKFNSRLNKSGDYSYFNINLFSGLDKNIFLADARTTDIDFGYNQAYSIYGTIFLPVGYEVEGIPKNISMIMPDTSVVLKRVMQIDDNILNFRITVEFSRPFYTVQEYPYFKEFNKQLYAKLNEQIVIKKKTGTP